jgi:hypothetical protein
VKKLERTQDELREMVRQSTKHLEINSFAVEEALRHCNRMEGKSLFRWYYEAGMIIPKNSHQFIRVILKREMIPQAQDAVRRQVAENEIKDRLQRRMREEEEERVRREEEEEKRARREAEKARHRQAEEENARCEEEIERRMNERREAEKARQR